MMSMTLIWTTLPAGVRRSGPGEPWTARVSLMLTPRLDVPDGTTLTLADFPEFLDWPKTLREMPAGGIEFDLVLKNHGDTEAIASLEVKPLMDPAPDSEAWRRLFSAKTPVKPFGPPQTEDTGLRSAPAMSFAKPYDSGDVVREIRSIYGEALRQELGLGAEEEPPPLQRLMGGKFGSNRASAINQFVDFHQPRRALLKTGPGADGEQDEDEELQAPEKPDFHQTLASLNNHPHLLRKLGLVFDVEVALDELPLDRADTDPAIRLEPRLPDDSNTLIHAPWTAFDYRVGSSTGFRLFTVAAPPQDADEGGLFALGDKTTIAQENYEHAALSLAQQVKAGDTASGEFPALLQGGMRVMHASLPDIVERAAREQAMLEASLQARRNASLLGSAGDDELLFADQLTLGVRADVRRDSGGPWRSLCRRSVQYSLGPDWSYPAGTDVLEDEGVIEPTVYKDHLSESDSLLTTSNLFEWDGWSLVVPRPEDGAPKTTLLPDKALPDGAKALEATFAVPPGSLEPQRFGRCYTFRTRTVFLAGVGLSPEEADAVEADLSGASLFTQPTCCLRVESAKPPVTVRAEDRGWGEAGDIVVLRDADDKRFRTQSFALHVLPPEVPLSIAEKHGMFDSMSPARAWDLIENHRGRLKRDEPARNELTPDDKPLESETVTDRELFTPYLPDPMVTQAVLTLPDDAGTVDMPRFDDLPRRVRGEQLARSCRLVVSAGNGDITSRVSGRDVLVELTRGRMHTLKLSARLSPEDLSIAAVAHQDWHNGDKLGDAADKLVKAASNGEAPLLAPAREIRVVYATQRPLVAPAFGRALILPRELNDTSARLADDALTFDRPSTGRLDIYARWDDPVDDPGTDGWTTLTNEMHAGGVDIDLEDGKPLDPIELEQASRSPLSHDFGDTKHHEVAYAAVATTRFVDFYPPEVTGEPGSTSLTSQNTILHVPATAPPAPPDIAYVIPTYRKDEVKPVRGIKDQHSVHLRGAGLRVYLQRGWFSSGKGEQLALLVATPNTPGELREQVSEWGVNPLRDAAPLPGPLEMAQVWGGAKRIEHWPLEEGSVGLVIYDVHWSDEHRLPFVDIEFMSQRAFMPLVRLAFARYQQHAIENCELSSIEHADFVPLTPGRAVTVGKLNRQTWKLDLRGYSYVEPDTSFTIEPEVKTSVVEAQIEVMPADAPEDDAAWRALGDPVSMSADSVEPWRMHWTGHVGLDEVEYLSRSWRRRLTIREYEEFAGDAPTADRSRLISAHAVLL